MQPRLLRDAFHTLVLELRALEDTHELAADVASFRECARTRNLPSVYCCDVRDVFHASRALAQNLLFVRIVQRLAQSTCHFDHM